MALMNRGFRFWKSWPILTDRYGSIRYICNMSWQFSNFLVLNIEYSSKKSKGQCVRRMNESCYSKVSNNRKTWKTPFHMTCKKGQIDNVKLLKITNSRIFSINLNVQHVNGMTHLDLAVPKRNVLLLDTQEQSLRYLILHNSTFHRKRCRFSFCGF